MDQNDSLVYMVPIRSIGQHKITLRCKNDRGNTAEDEVSIILVPFDQPVVTIENPIDNQTIFSQVSSQFKVQTSDFDLLSCTDFGFLGEPIIYVMLSREYFLSNRSINLSFPLFYPNF